MKGILQKCLLYSLSFAVSLTAFSQLFFTDASAASVYDNSYKTTDQLKIGLGCAENYAGSYTQLVSNMYGVQANGTPDIQAIKESFFAAQQDNSGTIAVSQVNGPVENTGRVAIMWSNTNNLPLQWGRNDPSSPYTPRASWTGVLIFHENNEGTGDADCTVGYGSVEYYANNTTFPISYPDSYFENYFFNGDPNYPDGYEGTTVVSSPTPPETVIRPDFSYEINNKDFTLKDHNQELPDVPIGEGYTGKGYQIEWTINRCGGWNGDTKICSNPEQVGYEILPQGEQYTYTGDAYAYYQISAQYIYQQCYRYPSYPATPDNCFYTNLSSDLDDYDFISTTVTINVDGSQISGDTKDTSCDASGYCEPASPYEDCTSYGLDVVGGFQCVMRNFGIFLTQLLKTLFVPSSRFYSEYWTSLTTTLNDKLGFIYQSIAAIIGILTGLIASSATPDCTFTPNGEFYGAHLNLNLCTFEEVFPTGWTVFQTIIIGLTVMALILAFQRKYHEVLEAR